MNPRFGRVHFDTDAEMAASLALDLQSKLTIRLVASSDPEAEARQMVRELIALGHDLYSFDEDGECWQIWMDNWIDVRGPNRLILHFKYEAGDGRSVEVTFGPWPTSK